MATVNATDVIDGDKNQHDINNITLAHGYAHWRDLREFGTVLADKTTDHTALILNALSQLSEGEALYIPRNVKWIATSNPSAVYAAMKDNCVLIDDSGCENRFGSTPFWQASQQIYFKTKDYGTSGKANGNGLNVRGEYHPYYTLENDADSGTGGCRSSIVFRFNEATIKGNDFQFGADMTDPTQAHIGAAIYGVGLLADDTTNLTSSKALIVGGYKSISPGCVAFNSSLVQDASFIVGKRKARVNQGTPEDNTTYKSSAHTIRIVQPTGHTGAFTKLWVKGSETQHREDISDAGDRTFTPKTSGNGSMVYTNLNELGGFKKRVITGSIGATVSTIYSNGYCSNFGAAGAQTVNLPVPTKGLTFEFGIDAPQNVRIVQTLEQTLLVKPLTNTWKVIPLVVSCA